MVDCKARHARPNVPDADFVCPECGARPTSNEPFVIDVSAGEDECALLHVDDECHCYGCGFTASGRAMARRYAKVQSLVKCPHCKGKGYVEGR